jgi:ribosomal protein L25 (general stress protein Ctc)
LYRQCGSSTPFDLVGGDINQMVLVQDFQKTNVSNMVYHVDFLAIDKDQKVQTHVPLKFT